MEKSWNSSRIFFKANWYAKVGVASSCEENEIIFVELPFFGVFN